MTAAEARTRGDATPEQRRELHTLIEAKAVDDGWLRRFYRQVRAASGLSETAATDALTYLRSLAAKGEDPTHATPEQGEALRELVRTRIVPNYLARLWLTRFDAGQLTYPEADRTILEYLRLPMRADTPRPGAAGETPEGYYSLLAADGNPRCYRIHRPNGGHLAVDQITSEKPGQRRRIRGHQAIQILRQIATDPDPAGRRYAETRKRCRDCNKELRRQDQPGFPHGFGPDCWAKRQKAGTLPLLQNG